MVQWLRLLSSAGGVGSIPGRRTKVPHAVGCSQKKNFFFNVKKKNDIFSLVQPKMGQKILWTALTKLFSKGSVGNVRVVEKGSSLRALSG